MAVIDKDNLGIIDINDKVSPSVLAGILNIPVSMVYDGRKDGKLPANTNATYKECIQHYILYYKNRINSRATSMGEAKLGQDIRNGIAKESLQWLEIKKTKEELLDINELKDLMEPIFHIIKSGLVNLSRKHPETQGTIDQLLESWFTLGKRIYEKADLDANQFVEEMLNRELNLNIEEKEEEVKTRYRIENVS